MKFETAVVTFFQLRSETDPKSASTSTKTFFPLRDLVNSPVVLQNSILTQRLVDLIVRVLLPFRNEAGRDPQIDVSHSGRSNLETSSEELVLRVDFTVVAEVRGFGPAGGDGL